MDATVQPVVRSPGKRRYRRSDEKRRIVEGTLAPEASVAVIARRHGVNANQMFHWRKLYQAGLLGTSRGMTPTFPIRTGSAWRDCCWKM
jgi:transposase